MTLATLLLYLAPLSCQAEPAPSLIVVLLDDVGMEHVSWSPQGQDAGNPVATPTLSALAAEGLRFTNLWTTPVCSSTRAALLTGKYGHRTGVGCVIPPGSSYALAETEATIADRLQVRGYETFLGGKFHLGEDPELPCAIGFSTWVGAQGNLGNGGNYWDWGRWDDTNACSATWTEETAYAPTVTTDAALAWIGAQEGAWFALVGYNLAHAPWHDPPGMGPFKTNLERYRAMIEYLDSEIGRLLACVDLDEVTVLILSDNGSPPGMALPPNTPEHSKFTSYRGGVETTMIVAGHAARRAIDLGKNTAGQEIAGHAHVVDLYRTALKLCPGPDPGGWPAVDSVSLYSTFDGFVAPREWNFTELAEPLGVPPGGPYEELSRAVEADGWKAVYDLDGVELYLVASDPWEVDNVLLDGISPEEQAVLDDFGVKLAGLGL